MYLRLVEFEFEFEQCPQFNPIEALSFLMALLTFRLTEQGTLTLVGSAHEKKQAFLHRHIPVPAVYLLLMWP
jgi:hypothetical protein